MPLNPRPLHAVEHPHPDPDRCSPGFREWSKGADDATPRAERRRTVQPMLPGIDLTHPLAQVAVVAFIGYTLGRLIHRHK